LLAGGGVIPPGGGLPPGTLGPPGAGEPSPGLFDGLDEEEQAVTTSTTRMERNFMAS
jgi:hypothetical protein